MELLPSANPTLLVTLVVHLSVNCISQALCIVLLDQDEENHPYVRYPSLLRRRYVLGSWTGHGDEYRIEFIS
jgi:hypothetical protein